MLYALADISQRVLGSACGMAVSGFVALFSFAERNTAMIAWRERRDGLAILEAGQR